jgi:hypothetical protein
MQACGRWFVPLGKTPVCIAVRVVDKKLMPFIEMALQSGEYQTREAVAGAIEQLLRKLDVADAHWAVSSPALVEWAARALLEVEPETKEKKRKRKRTFSYDGYRQFRATQSKSALSFALVEVCSHIALASTELSAKGVASIELVREQLTGLSPELVARLVDADEARVTATLAFFRDWWAELTDTKLSPGEQLRAIRETRFHDLLERESALLRFALEMQLLGELFPRAEQTSGALAAEFRAFGQAVQQHIHGLMHAGSISGWNKIVSVGTRSNK